jgi:hypothetical protein
MHQMQRRRQQPLASMLLLVCLLLGSSGCSASRGIKQVRKQVGGL